MTTLALDVATCTGWACSDGEYGSLDLSPYAGSYPAMGWSFSRGLSDLIAMHGVSQVVIERPFYRGGATSVFLLNGLAFLAIVIAHGHECRIVEATAAQARKAIGLKPSKAETKGERRKQNKAAVVAWAMGRGYAPRTEDEADALALLHWALSDQGLPDIRAQTMRGGAA